jgi:DNA modification methylase
MPGNTSMGDVTVYDRRKIPADMQKYFVRAEIGLESTPEDYVARLVEVFREVRRVLREDGTLWLNLGDSYAGSWGAQSRNGPVGGISDGQIQAHPNGTRTGSLDRTPGLKPKDLCGIPWRVAFALQADGWYLRSDIIWAKPNPMPESVRDRPTKAHEYIFLLSKSERYMYDADAIAEDTTDPEYRTNGKIRPTAEGGPGFEIRGGLHQQVGGRLTRNRRSVWTITTKPYPEAHFATFPPELPELCIKAGSKPGDAVLDPFAGAGTTLLTAKNLNRQAVGVELNPEYCRLIERRCAQGVLAM